MKRLDMFKVDDSTYQKIFQIFGDLTNYSEIEEYLKNLKKTLHTDTDYKKKCAVREPHV